MSKKVTRVIVAGGGFGGVKTALNLANKPGFQVTLISDNTHFEYHGALYRSAVGRSPMEVVIPLKQIFAGLKNVELVLDSVGIVEPKKHRIASQTGNVYEYDKAVFALGNTVNYFGIKGLSEHTETMHDISSTLSLRKSLVDLFKSPEQTPKRIIVVGAGPSGVELVGELPAFAELVAKKYGVKAPKLKISLIDAADRVLPMFSPKASAKTTRHLHKLGIELHLKMKVDSCGAGILCMQSGDLQADLIIWTAGSTPVSFYSQNPDVFTLGRGGRVVVDEQLRSHGQKDIYVLGDNADTKYSGMAQTALHDANYVAKSLLAKSKRKIKPYRNHKPIYVVTAGPKWAVVQQGDRVITGRRGWRIRRRADLTIFRNFEPYKQAIKTWRQSNKLSNF